MVISISGPTFLAHNRSARRRLDRAPFGSSSFIGHRATVCCPFIAILFPSSALRATKTRPSECLGLHRLTSFMRREACLPRALIGTRSRLPISARPVRDRLRDPFLRLPLNVPSEAPQGLLLSDPRKSRFVPTPAYTSPRLHASSVPGAEGCTVPIWDSKAPP